MDPGYNAEPGAGPVEDWDSLSDKETIALLRRRLLEAENNAKLWKEQADEVRTEYIKCKSNARVLQTELENTQKELARIRAEAPKQGALSSRELREEFVDQVPSVTTTAAAEAAKVDKSHDGLDRDYALAKQLEQELNSGDFSFKAGVASDHRPPVRSAANSLWNAPVETQLEKAKAKILFLKKKLEEMEGYTYEYQRAYQQERSHHHRMYNQAKGWETELNATKKRISRQDEELKAVRDKWNEMKEMKEELGSFLDRWSAHIGSLPESASHSAEE
ncbi:hypothetical protein H1R20_g2035, partial [Candolleomyces eurysporus]